MLQSQDAPGKMKGRGQRPRVREGQTEGQGVGKGVFPCPCKLPAQAWLSFWSPEIPGSSNSATQWPCRRGAEKCGGKPKLDGRKEKYQAPRKIESSVFLPPLRMWHRTSHRILVLGRAVLLWCTHPEGLPLFSQLWNLEAAGLSQRSPNPEAPRPLGR